MTPTRAVSVAPRVRAALEALLLRALELRDHEGHIICPEHGIEHTGKNAYFAVIAAELWRMTGEARWSAVAVAEGRRLVERLEREGTSACHTFRPGRHDPYNCSNSVIDGGACADALSHLVLHLGSELDAPDREAFAAASLLHARTYLRYAVLDKGIPAQRAWALTGLAGAWRLEPDRVLEDAALQAVGMLEAIQLPDGSHPYHPVEWGAEHPGSADASAFYQSRVTGFTLWALEMLGRDPADPLFRGPLERGLAFLLALQGVDGVKTGLVEAKPWYWGATTEVASHPFDIYALAAGWRYFGGDDLARGAVRAFEAWEALLGPDGFPRSHAPGPGRGRSYQCPLFWAAHAAWLARAAPDLTRALEQVAPSAPGGASIDLRVKRFPGVDLVRLEDGAVVAWVRGRRPPSNVHHGSPHGAGLLRVQRVRDGAELLPRCRLGGHNAAEWNGRAGFASLRRGLAAGLGPLRFSIWLARVHLRAGRPGDALLEPLRTFRRGVLAFGHPRVSTAFDPEPRVELLPDGVRLECALAWRDGTRLADSHVVREFRVDGDGLEVRERLLAPGGARGVEYTLPAGATAISRAEGEVRYRLA